MLVNYYYLVCELCFSLSFALCILALLFGSPRLKRPFEWSPLRWLGMISYSLYMWHLPLLIAFIQLGPSLQQLPPALAYGLYGLLVLLLIIPFSFFFFLFVEKLGIKLGEHLQHQKQPTTTVPPVAPVPPTSKVPIPTNTIFAHHPLDNTRHLVLYIHHR